MTAETLVPTHDARAPMYRRTMRKMTIRARALIRRWQRNTDGMAAVEFAFIVPVMSVMFMGAVELSQAITVDRRVTQAASSTADLVARAEASISQAEIGDIMKIGGFIMAPHNSGPLQIVLRNVTSSPTNATVAKQSWTCTYDADGGPGGTPKQTCECTNTTFTLPAELVTTNDSVVVSDVTYGYKPPLFDFFLKKAFGGSDSTGAYTLRQTVFTKPRSQTAMLLQADGTPCPGPTF